MAVNENAIGPSKNCDEKQLTLRLPTEKSKRLVLLFQLLRMHYLKHKETANQTQSALKQAQSDFSNAEASYNSINTLQISDSRVEALKSYVNNPVQYS